MSGRDIPLTSAMFDAGYSALRSCYEHDGQGVSVVAEIYRAMRSLEPVSASHGCICPPKSEETCKGPMCPRRPVDGRAA